MAFIVASTTSFVVATAPTWKRVDPAASKNSVAVGPGHSATTRSPIARVSSEIAAVRLVTYAFVAA